MLLFQTLVPAFLVICIFIAGHFFVSSSGSGLYISDFKIEPEEPLELTEEVNPRDIDPRKQSRSKYYPHSLDLQQGVRVFESSKHKAMIKVREIIKRRQQNDFKNHQQNSRKQSEADSL